MDGVSGHRTRVADYEGWVGIRGVCGCLPCSLCILGHLCGSLDLISTRFECLGVIMFFRKDLPQTEGRRNADHKIKTPPASGIAIGDGARFSDLRAIVSTRNGSRFTAGGKLRTSAVPKPARGARMDSRSPR